MAVIAEDDGVGVADGGRGRLRLPKRGLPLGSRQGLGKGEELLWWLPHYLIFDLSTISA